jgi:hypothetical protein
MTTLTVEFGYFPQELDIANGAISIATLPTLATTIADVGASDTIHNDWVYAPPQLLRDVFKGKTYQLPHASRIFGLPKTHVLKHARADGPEHLNFLVWCLGFFVGMRLTTSDRGFLDATPTKVGSLVDFVLSPAELATAVSLAEAYWQAQRNHHRHTKRIEGIVHSLFLSNYPLLLEFERFMLLYTALDACYALVRSRIGGSALNHVQRIEWTCQQFGLSVPSWAQPSNKKTEISIVRNDTLHEALFFEEPLGFSVYGGAQRVGGVLLEMQALVCRLLVALLGKPNCAYVKTPVNTRQRYALDLS